MNDKPINKRSERGVTVYSQYNDQNALLKELGIDILTGEACALSMRLLCELTGKALELYLDYAGLRIDYVLVPHSNYNDPDKYALFLDRDLIANLVVYYLCHAFNVVQVIRVKADQGYHADTLYYCADDGGDIREYIAQHEAFYDHYVIDDKGDYKLVDGLIYSCGRLYTTGSGQRRGFSNVHGFTGISQ